MDDKENAPAPEGARGSDDCHSWQGDNQENSTKSKSEQRKAKYFNSAAFGGPLPDDGWPFGMGTGDGCDPNGAAYDSADPQGDARYELEQRLLGLQIKGALGAIEFASAKLRQLAASFEVPHPRIQQAILDIADRGHPISVQTIAAELGEYAAFFTVGGVKYLQAMGGAAPATATMEGLVSAWRHLQGTGPKVGSVALVRGDAVEPQPVRWIWKFWLAQSKLHLLAGQPGTGKTSIAIDIAATITCGDAFPDGCPTPVGNVLIWSGEDDFRDTILPRFIACGGVRERLHFIGGRYDENCALQDFDPAEDMQALVAAAAQIPDLRLIIIDPIVSAVPGDSHKNAEVRRALQPLVQLAERGGAAVIGLTHLTKGTAGREPLERITGSLAFGALPRLVWYTIKSNEQGEPSRLVRAKSNIGPDGDGFEYNVSQMVFDEARGLAAQAIKWGEPLFGSARDLVAELEGTQGGGRVSALDAAMTWLEQMLGTGTVRSAYLQDAAKQAGHSWPTVQRAKTALCVESVKLGSEWSWKMPKVINPAEGDQ